MLSENLESVTQRIRRACEKAAMSPEEVTLVCVTKEISANRIKEALSFGVRDIGENRVRGALEKYNTVGDAAKWHLVGHLQTNKVKDAVGIFSLIHSVDSVRLAKEIDKEASGIGKVQDILVQVNISGEKTKFGISPENSLGLIKEISLYNNINIKGLMTIAPEVDDPEKARPYFKALRELLDRLNAIRPPATQRHSCSRAGNTQYSILSMGMSNDFEVAIEEGSNMVRIGRAIFG